MRADILADICPDMSAGIILEGRTPHTRPSVWGVPPPNAQKIGELEVVELWHDGLNEGSGHPDTYTQRV